MGMSALLLSGRCLILGPPICITRQCSLCVRFFSSNIWVSPFHTKCSSSPGRAGHASGLSSASPLRLAEVEDEPDRLRFFELELDLLPDDLEWWRWR